MCALPERVHAGVGASRAGHRQACAADSLKGSFQVILNGVAVLLALPASEISPVVTDNQLGSRRDSRIQPVEITLQDDLCRDLVPNATRFARFLPRLPQGPFRRDSREPFIPGHDFA